jgi:hypothetical protein
LKSQIPFDIENNKYLYNYLHEHDLVDKLKWFTPLCEEVDGDVFNKQKFLSQIVTCKGIRDEDVKKYLKIYI